MAINSKGSRPWEKFFSLCCESSSTSHVPFPRKLFFTGNWASFRSFCKIVGECEEGWTSCCCNHKKGRRLVPFKLSNNQMQPKKPKTVWVQFSSQLGSMNVFDNKTIINYFFFSLIFRVKTVSRSCDFTSKRAVTCAKNCQPFSRRGQFYLLYLQTYIS